MIVHDFAQYSPEWWSVRRGVPTASSASKILPSTGKPSTQQSTYIHDLVGDLYDPQYGYHEDYASAAMKNGHILEPRVRDMYDFLKGGKDGEVYQVGFCTTDDGRFGCSPDALVGEDGGLEIKSPKQSTQVKYLLADKVPAEYVPQVHFSLVVTGRKWWDFVSHCPGLPPLMVRVKPDDYTEQMRSEMDRFYEKLDKAKKKIAALDEGRVDVPEKVMF